VNLIKPKGVGTLDKTANYDWVPFYKGLADALLQYKNNRDALVTKVKKIYEQTNIKFPTLDKEGCFTDIDPFTFYGLFNKQLTSQNRIAIIKAIAELFDIKAQVPTSFDGIPVVDNRNATYYRFIDTREEHDIDDLWRLFETALAYSKQTSDINRSDFVTAFDKVMHMFGSGNSKITMGLYWFAPDVFLNLDRRTIWYMYDSDLLPSDLKNELPKVDIKISAEKYLEIIEKVNQFFNRSDSKFKSFKELSLEAWWCSEEENKRIEEEKKKKQGQKSDDDWIPKISEFNPGLSADNYYDLFKDENTVKPAWLDALYELYKMPDQTATCKQMGNKYGHMPSHYISYLGSAAHNIVKETNIETAIIEGKEKYWPVLFLGKETTDKMMGNFLWRMREPVKKAIEMLIEEGRFEQNEAETKINYNQNMILYGPPGTGKTYKSIIYAVAICDHKAVNEVEQEPYEEILKQYKQLADEGRVVLTTFHQSYGYEEFIEGIKPVLNAGSIAYKVEDGIFKKFCNRAKAARVQTSGNVNMKKEPRIWGMLLGGTGMTDLKEKCFANNEIRLGWSEVADDEVQEDFTTDSKSSWNAKHMVYDFINSMEIGDIVVIEKTKKSIDAIGVVTGPYQYDKADAKYSRSRSVEWLVKDIDQDIVQYLPDGRKQLSRFSLFSFDYIGIDAITEILNNNQAGLSIKVEHETKPCVFIIDEINRGNISKIFGELITLIEETKRAGAKEAMEAVLPYSGNRFSVPKNVYILGTMNTADRSIALIDTALRRRFKFIEMRPESKVLTDLGVGTLEADGMVLNIAKMLDIMNERIEYLYDREHTIGHAFFTKLKDDCCIETLAKIFENEIIPLLQEYFNEDYEKIQLVLGDNDKEEEFKFIVDKEVKLKEKFNGSTEIDIPEKSYTVNSEAFLKLNSYKLISKGL